MPYHNGEVRVVELLVRELGVDIDSRQPASVSRVSGVSDLLSIGCSRVIPAAEKIILANSLVGLLELDHVLERLDVSVAEGEEFTSFPAFTLVSVPWTGSAAASVIQKAWSRTRPYMTPMISYWPPDRAWMTWRQQGLEQTLPS